MRYGDLSNEMPRRLLVHIDLFLIKKPRVEKKFKIIPTIKYDFDYDRLFLNKLYLFTTRAEMTLELVSFEHTEDELLLLYNELDRLGTNPFRYYSVFKSADNLVSQLPYRPEVIGVLDLDERKLVYGHWGLDF